MGKQFSKKVNAFDKETYEANQQAVKALKAAGMSQIAISRALKMSQSTVNNMLHKTYEEYDQFRKEKYAKRQAVINGKSFDKPEPKLETYKSNPVSALQIAMLTDVLRQTNSYLSSIDAKLEELTTKKKRIF